MRHVYVCTVMGQKGTDLSSARAFIPAAFFKPNIISSLPSKTTSSILSSNVLPIVWVWADAKVAGWKNKAGTVHAVCLLVFLFGNSLNARFDSEESVAGRKVE